MKIIIRTKEKILFEIDTIEGSYETFKTFIKENQNLEITHTIIENNVNAKLIDIIDHAQISTKNLKTLNIIVQETKQLN